MSTQAEVIQHQMQARATERLLGSGDWIFAEEMARLGDRSSRNAQALAHTWSKKGLIFAIRHEGKTLYPAYALDARTGHRPHTSLAPILEVLQGVGRSGWAIACWFDSPNSYLNGRRPKDCLTGPLDQLLRAARAEAQGNQHG